MLKFFFVERPPTTTKSQAEEVASIPPDRASARTPEGPEAAAASESDVGGSVEPGPMALQPARRSETRPRPSPPVKTGPAPAIARQASPSGGERALEFETPEPEPAPARVSAGRVPRELSRKPVRFLWQTDAASRVLFVSPGLAQVVGRNAEIVGEHWQAASDRLRLDPSGRIARALAHRDTWSGLTAWWPIEGSNVRVPVELTALPVFGGDHSFQGYRGFGVLRPAEALMPAAFDARFGTADRPMPSPGEQLPPYEEAVATVPANVIPIRADVDHMADHARLSPQERSAFEEIAAALRSRVTGDPAREGDVSPASLPSQKPAVEQAEPESPAPSVVPFVGRDQEAESEQLAVDSGPPREMTPQDPRSERSRVAHPAQGRREATAPDELADSAGRAQAAFRARLAEAERRLQDLSAILDTATDGVVVLDADGAIESVNASAEALFGLDAHEMRGMPFGDLLTPESRQSALDYLSGLRDSGVASLLNEGRELEARAGPGSIPLFMTMGRISSDEGERFCAVLRDITHWKRSEAELVAARRTAEDASKQKSEFLARVSHEIRTPLNAIIGFAEVMIEERFGPVENERYREYLRDIRTSGEHVVSLVNDLLDISKIEAGKLDLHFSAVPLNDLVRDCMGLMQPQANRAHVVLRSSLSRDVPAIVADARTLRQIVLNLLSNSTKFTGPGGQVIASTSLSDMGEAVLRIRDTGEGMSDAELARAMEPFRQLSTATIADRTGSGLGLPLTKALVEANRASMTIRSARGEGTVVTVTFPPTRVLSE
jgi:PAS domain S-box-containing protein